jgi:hypothetical protein
MSSNPYGNLFALHNGVVRAGTGSYGGQSPFPGQASPVMGSLGSQPTQPQMPGSASPIQGGLGSMPSYGPVNMPAQPVSGGSSGAAMAPDLASQRIPSWAGSAATGAADTAAD